VGAYLEKRSRKKKGYCVVSIDHVVSIRAKRLHLKERLLLKRRLEKGSEGLVVFYLEVAYIGSRLNSMLNDGLRGVEISPSDNNGTEKKGGWMPRGTIEEGGGWKAKSGGKITTTYPFMGFTEPKVGSRSYYADTNH